MKYLLAYQGFNKFKVSWHVKEEPDGRIMLSRGPGLIETGLMQRENGGYNGKVIVITGNWLCYKLTQEPLKIRLGPQAGDSIPFSLSQKYHNRTMYRIHFMNCIEHCVLVTEEEKHEILFQPRKKMT